MSSVLRVSEAAGGRVRRFVLAKPKGNVLDAELVAALDVAFSEAGRDRRVSTVILSGDGGHFSFGASVPEHLPGSVAGMLDRFHGLFRTMLESRLVCLAAVRGQCLGGGLELASFCQRVFAAPGAKLGQPEIVLGVFAPVASLWLADRVGRAVAEDLCLTGRVVEAPEALATGLVDEVHDDPEAAALAWAERHLARHSAASLRVAVAALRLDRVRAAAEALPRLERLYLDELMATHDAEEGLAAFLERRAPAWRDA